MTHQRTERENKFDRQMRLWGSHGQDALESSHVCVLGSGATASEALKNLVLPNVGSFLLLDDARVTQEDLGNNFFLDEDSIGQSRAEAVLRLMREMNADVRGEARAANAEQVIASEPHFFRQFSLVIACQLPQPALLSLSSLLFPLNIPLIALRCHGLIGHARLQVREHRIVESHPSNDRADLFIHPSQLQLWPELQRYIDSFLLLPRPAGVKEAMEDTTVITMDEPHLLPGGTAAESASASAVAPAPPSPTAASSSSSASPSASSSSPYLNGDGLDAEHHAHIPYLVILAQLMRRWLSGHAAPPSSYEEKRQFKQSVIDDSWDFASETNYAEAVDFAHRAYDRPQLDGQTAAVLTDDAATRLRRDSEAFWLVVAGVRRFVEQEGGGFALPVSSDIPDMHSKTDWYVQLKAVFKQRSERDTAAVVRHVRQIQAELGLPPYNEATAAVAHDCNGRPVPDSLRVVCSRSVTELSDADIARVVPHVRCLRVVRTTAIADELQAASPSHAASAISSILEEAEYEAMDAPQPEPGSFVPPNPPLLHWYLALRAVDAFRVRQGRLPGLLSQAEVEAVMRREEQETAAEELDQSWRQDVDGVVAALQELRAGLGLAGEGDSSCAEELVRAGACEPHVVAAFMGGLGSQMALKLLLHQYVPLNNTLLYNGYHCASQTWNL